MSSQINEKCNFCGACQPACPTQSISKGGRTFVVDSDTCTNCLLCAPVCPVDAVENLLLPPKRKKKTKK
ncbi:MAG: indolepyruvate ferredoxin oxidoreductase subunit alpha [Bdellovibrionota bacterium]